jgi:hypothetical protein
MNFDLWERAFRSAIKRGVGKALEWDLPEAWLHAELFSHLKEASDTTKWMPFPTEIPYFTESAVLPRGGKTSGVKWADLCLVNQKTLEWCWFEFKVRHLGSGTRKMAAALSGRNAFKKDVVRLMGMNISETQSIWEHPPPGVKSHIIPTHLSGKAASLAKHRNHYVAAFLQIGSSTDDENLWLEEPLNSQIQKWASTRKLKQVSHLKFKTMQIENCFLCMISIERLNS